MAEAAVVLRGLYRRLREKGEDPRMLRRAISVNTMEHNVALARRFLTHHRALLEATAQASQTSSFRVVRHLSLKLVRWRHHVQLVLLRCRLHSVAALSDILIYCLCGAMLFFTYQIYHLCRVGLTKAEEKYQTLAIPIVQTIESLELAEARRKAMRADMERDIVKQRTVRSD